MSDASKQLRCGPHPISGAIYQELGEGLVRVEDKAKGKSGVFRWDGALIEGDLTQADLHYLRYIGGPTMPPEKDIFWSLMPVGELGQAQAVSGKGGELSPRSVPEADRRQIIGRYVADPGKKTKDGMRSVAHIPLEFYLDNDRRKELIPPVYRKSAPYPGGPKKVPVGRFIDRKFHDLEVEHLWSKVWQMACREDDIPGIGDYILYRIASLEYIVVRTAERTFKAYRNVCLHRGRRLTNHDGKSATEFRCPYHAWSWKIDGSLKELPCEWDFPGVKEEVCQLPEAKVAIWGGFVFINPDPKAISFEEYAGPEMLEHYAKNKLENRYKQVHVGGIIKANWKLMMEAFLEAYHANITHPQLLLSGGDLADTRYDVFGNWGRMGHVGISVSSPQRGMIASEQQSLEAFRRAADFNRNYLRGLIGDEVEKFSDTEMVEQTFSNLFPNFSPWSGWARIVYRFRPNGDRHDECLMEVMLLAPWPEGKPKPPAAKLHMLKPGEAWASAHEMGTLGRVVDQDTSNVPDVFLGLKAMQPPYVIYSAYQESRIRAFHDTYEKLLGLKKGE